MGKMSEEFKFLQESNIVESVETMTGGTINGNMLVVRIDKKVKTIFVAFNALVPISTAFRINVKKRAIYKLKNGLNFGGVVTERMYLEDDADFERYMYWLSSYLLEERVPESYIEQALAILRYSSTRAQALEILNPKTK